MKHVRALILGLLCALAAPAVRADPAEENGGVIILHADYHFYWGNGAKTTLVIVASDREARALALRLASGEVNPGAIRIEEEQEAVAFEVRLVPLRDGRLVGCLPDTGHSVMVVTRSYASSHFSRSERGGEPDAGG